MVKSNILGAKPYKCKMCSKAYGIRQSLRYHMQNTHGIRDLAIDQNKNQLQAISSFQYPWFTSTSM